MNKLKEIYQIFFPKTLSEKYKHIGYSYAGVPTGWKSIVEYTIQKIEKEMWPQWYLPMFIKRLIHYLATENSVVGIKYKNCYKLRRYLTKGQIVMDIKDKFAGLRIYGYFDKPIDRIVEEAEIQCENTCEYCGSTEDTQVVGSHWVENLCINCREKNGKKDII
jgi:hypothetical protein